MKKSNKILLGGFLAVVLLLSAVHFSLWAKYRNGNYVDYQPEDELASMVMQSFPHVKFVSVRHVPNLNVHFSDSTQVEKVEGSGFRYTQTGDTLVISGTDTSGQQNFYRPIGMRLPRTASLQAFKSSLSFRDSKGGSGGSPFLFLNGASARFDGIMLDGLSIRAINQSSVEFAGGRVGNVQLDLQNSTLEDAMGDMGQLTITTDSLSRIALQAKHFSKAKTTTPAHE